MAGLACRTIAYSVDHWEAPFSTTTLELSVPFIPSLSVTVNSNKYEFASTFPTTIGALNVAIDVFHPFKEIGGASSSESSMHHA